MRKRVWMRTLAILLIVAMTMADLSIPVQAASVDGAAELVSANEVEVVEEVTEPEETEAAEEVTEVDEVVEADQEDSEATMIELGTPIELEPEVTTELTYLCEETGIYYLDAYNYPDYVDVYDGTVIDCTQRRLSGVDCIKEIVYMEADHSYNISMSPGADNGLVTTLTLTKPTVDGELKGNDTINFARTWLGKLSVTESGLYSFGGITNDFVTFSIFSTEGLIVANNGILCGENIYCIFDESYIGDNIYILFECNLESETPVTLSKQNATILTCDSEQPCEIESGQTALVGFTPDETGTYAIYAKGDIDKLAVWNVSGAGGSPSYTMKACAFVDLEKDVTYYWSVNAESGDDTVDMFITSLEEKEYEFGTEVESDKPVCITFDETANGYVNIEVDGVDSLELVKLSTCDLCERTYQEPSNLSAGSTREYMYHQHSRWVENEDVACKSVCNRAYIYSDEDTPFLFTMDEIVPNSKELKVGDFIIEDEPGMYEYNISVDKSGMYRMLNEADTGKWFNCCLYVVETDGDGKDVRTEVKPYGKQRYGTSLEVKSGKDLHAESFYELEAGKKYVYSVVADYDYAVGLEKLDVDTKTVELDKTYTATDLEKVGKYVFTPTTSGFYAMVYTGNCGWMFDVTSAYVGDISFDERADAELLDCITTQGDGYSQNGYMVYTGYTSIYELEAGQTYTFFVEELGNYDVTFNAKETKTFLDYDVYMTLKEGGATFTYVDAAEVPEEDSQYTEYYYLGGGTSLCVDVQGDDTLAQELLKLNCYYNQYDNYSGKTYASLDNKNQGVYKMDIRNNGGLEALYTPVEFYKFEGDSLDNVVKLDASATIGNESVFLVKLKNTLVPVATLKVDVPTQMEVGDVITLDYTVKSADGGTPTFTTINVSSYTPAVVTARSDKATLTAVAPGTAYVVVASGDTRISKTYTIEVVKGSYKITYELDGGTNSAANPDKYKDTTATFTLEPATKKGYTFEGWYTDQDFENQIEKVTKGSNGNLTLYAKFTENQYNIAFDANNSAAVGEMADMTGIGYDDEVTLSANTLSANGYSFVEWNTKADGSGKSYADKATVSKLAAQNGKTVTLYAVWAKNKYTITYDMGMEGVTNPSSNPTSYNVTTKDITFANPTKKGYTFLGWFDELDQHIEVLEKGSTGNVNLTAKWRVNNYTIKWILDDGEERSMSVDYGKTAQMMALEDIDYDKSGYTLKNWNTKADGSGTAYALGQEVSNLTSQDGKVITVYAIWTKDKYTISYVLGEGASNSADNPMNYTVTSKDITLAAPTKKGYTFGGWYTNEACSDECKLATISKGSTGNITLYAKWTENQYDIAFNGNHATVTGEMPAMTEIGYDDVVTLSENGFEREGYTFKSWNTKADGSGTNYADGAEVSKLNKNDGKTVTLYAIWQKEKYTISYELDGGTNNKANPATYTVSTKTITLAAPTKKGYTFGGWYTDADCEEEFVTTITKGSTGNVTLYAKWTEHQYSIVFNGNHASVTGEMSDMTEIGYDDPATLSENGFEREGYTFKSWNTKADGSGTNYADGAEVSKLASKDGKVVNLYAIWTKDKYTITYELDGGTNNKANPATYTVTSKTITVAAPTKKGYTFGGWYTDAECEEAMTTILKGSTGNVTLYAKWTENEYTIAFNSNHAKATGEMETISGIKYDDPVTLTENGFTRTGYTFKGWNTKADGSGKSYADGAEVSKLASKDGKVVNLYAIWTKDKYTITYELDGGTNNTANPATYTVTTKTITLAAPTKKGYTFGGWYTDAECQDEAVTTILKGSTGNKTLYAKWTENQYNIAFNKNHAKATGEMETISGIGYDDPVTLSENGFEREGYTFKSWNTKADGTGKTYTDGAEVSKLNKNNGKTVTLYAIWQKEKYTISYVVEDGTNNAKNPATYTITTTTITLKKPKYTGDGFNPTFGGWYTSPDFEEDTKVTTIPKGSTGNMTLYAKWIFG